MREIHIWTCMLKHYCCRIFIHCIREKFIHAILHQFHVLVTNTPNTTPTSNATKTVEPTTNCLLLLHFSFLRSPTCTFKFHGSETTFSTCCFTMFSFVSSQHFQSNHIHSLKQHCSSLHLPQLKLSCFQLTLLPLVLLLGHNEPTYRWIILRTKTVRPRATMYGAGNTGSRRRRSTLTQVIWCCPKDRSIF